jgi:predicted hotdog family 3-hydroxylacyl-ACP dehydratase
MRLLDELVDLDDGSATSLVRISERSPFSKDGVVPALVAIEYMAQTAAAFGGAERLRVGLPVQLGLLIACDRLALEVESLSAGDEVLVSARRVWSSDSLVRFHCLARRSGQAVAEATLDFYLGQPPELPGA